jgi:hypothetical protein
MSTQAVVFSPEVALPPVTLAEIEAAQETPAMRDDTDLASKTVFLRIRFGALGNQKKVAGDVLETDADKSLLKVSKTLLDSPELDAIRKADGQMRNWLYNICLPYDMGIMLLPLGLIETVQQRLVSYRAERQVMVDTFVEAYPQLCAHAAEQLGSLFDVANYPDVSEIKARFVYEWQYVSFGVPGTLAGISQEIFNSEKQKAAQQMQAATEEITAVMRQTLFEMVSHLQDRLTPTPDGRPRILRESAVKNLQEFLSTFDLRNVTDDRDLAAEVKKVRELISGTSAVSLRSSDEFREKVRAGMEGITSNLAGMVEEVVGRKFRTEDY